MEINCTRPSCPRPLNLFPDLDDSATLKTAQRKFCITCGMPLILLERYLPSRLLGKGGFGAAFLARDRYTPSMRPCVVKLFKPAPDLTPSQLQTAQSLFEREAEVLEKLGNRHDQIPELYAFFPLIVPSIQRDKQEQYFYLVQEFIDGKTLEQELAEKGKFSEAEVLEVLRQIIPVLKFVHDNGTIHRDIKLSNIMRNQNGLLYLLDFGAVKQVTKGLPPGTSGRSTGIYTPGFAPLEQMTGGEIYPSTDLYALAVTCIILLTGKHEPNELFDAYNNRWNWRENARVSDRLANILDRMLKATPNERYQSAEDVRDALMSATPPPIVQAPTLPPPAIQPTPPPPQVNRSQFSLIETLGGAAFTGFEGGLLLIALSSLVPSPAGISVGLWGMILGALIFAQYRRIIEGKDLPIIAAITLGVVLFFPPLQTAIAILNIGNPISIILAGAILTAAGAIAVTALFRLIYKLLSNMF